MHELDKLQVFDKLKFAVEAAITSPDYSQESARKKQITSRLSSGIAAVVFEYPIHFGWRLIMNGNSLLIHSIAVVGLLFFGSQTAADQGWVHYKDAQVKLHGGPIQGEGAKCTAWNTTNDDMQIHYKFGYFGPDPGFHTVWETDLWIEAGSLGGSASGAPPASEWTCEITFIGKPGDISATLCDDQPDNWSYFCLHLDEYLEPVKIKKKSNH